MRNGALDEVVRALRDAHARLDEMEKRLDELHPTAASHEREGVEFYVVDTRTGISAARRGRAR